MGHITKKNISVSFFLDPLYIFYRMIQLVHEKIIMNYNIQIQSIKDFKSSSSQCKQKVPSRTMVISSKTRVILIKSQLMKLSMTMLIYLSNYNDVITNQ